MSTERSTLIVRLTSLVAGAAAAAALAGVAYATGHPSIGKGAIQGASVTLGIFVLLWALGRRGGMANRVATGGIDERDDRILTLAFSDAALTMALAAIGSMIGAFYGLPGEGVAAIVLTAGLVTVLVSAVVRSRRL